MSQNWSECQHIADSQLDDYHALKMDSTNNVAIHNKNYLPATAQILGFDLFTPDLSSNNTNDNLRVHMSTDGVNFSELNSPNPTRYSAPPANSNFNPALWGNLDERPAVDLQLPNYSDTTGDAYHIQYQLNRPDYARRGFERFYLNIPDKFRGKSVFIKFELSSPSGQTIYLDNVGAANPNTKLGIPRLNEQLPVNSEEFQEQFRENYLIVKPQYTLSYNDFTKTPNWVSFQLNCAWTTSTPNENTDNINKNFNIDTDIPWQPLLDDSYKSSSFIRGHLAGSNERRRTKKDRLATYVTSNVLPSFEPDPWQNFEKELRAKVFDKITNQPVQGHKDVYIITGGYGSLNSLYSGNPLVQNGVTIPDRLWKIAVILKKPGYRIQDINANAISEVIAIDVPNRHNTNSIFVGKTKSSDWLTEISTLEQKTGLTFLSNLPELLQSQIKNTKHWTSTP